MLLPTVGNPASHSKYRPVLGFHPSRVVPGTAAAVVLDRPIEKLTPNKLTWAEIPFSSLQEELDAIDEYEREEDLDRGSSWPKFLRGAAYEYWGQPNLALAQYATIEAGTNLLKVPELWERKAYNCFKIGNVMQASAFFDIAINLYNLSVGNELHFVHWFYRHFKDYVPKWNGPPAPVQRGICKYCMGMSKIARESFVAQIVMKKEGMEHALLWFLAASYKSHTDEAVLECDLKIVHSTISEQFDWNPRLRLFIDLYLAYANGVFGRVAELEEELSNAVKKDGSDDIVTKVYIALYHDAFTKDESERDRALDELSAVGTTSKQNDTENFLFHTAVNRFSAPGKEKSDVSKSLG
ncbi:hypothetical protein BWQ96_10401 [Gracilariopsis chorda]|uniref:Uncharacterized protein n=1 Tax=Gracilariopsis chorda TaxID=448386 RepID=A0A2V3ICV1_9FLOR|nr:hypothetical protein BWQ96_10401 [Gracilariopsis chorda]|eukprot:PXF39891.1 hypothetical protein BWQ96_10401 [Gracilariopsis chorda]